jgi:Asp-tRNA(Asn)/Glu-tRNA(Gln) amidotransferase A subunit family amidase
MASSFNIFRAARKIASDCEKQASRFEINHLSNPKDAFAEYFQRYDAFLCPVTLISAPPHGLAEYVINDAIDISKV